MAHSITLQNVADTDIVDNDILGQICFAAPNEAGGTDSILIAASMFARSEGTFAADNNATELVFVTAASESAAPGATNYDMTLSSGGNLTLAGNLELGHASDTTIARSSAGVITVEGTEVILAGAVTGITSLLATDIKIGEDDQTKIDFETANQINFYADNTKRVTIDSTGLTVDSGSIETATIDYTDGDNAMTIADGGGVTFPQAATFTSGLQSNGAVTVGVDDTGHDVKFFGATSGAYALFDESEDRLHLVGVNYVQEAVPANDTPTAEDATVTLDLKKGNYHNISLGNNVTKFEFTNAKRGQKFILRITQNASSAKTVSWSNVDSASDGTAATVRWASNSAPTMSTSTSHTDVYGFLCTNNAGTEFDGFIIGQDLPD
tara:strand:- start:52 stop:1191 length:1140 start_codon:yes stop_codon:yes gene_type:complete